MTTARLFDDDARARAGVPLIVGVDEAGRGPLAGPVVAAAVALLPAPSRELDGARDSKTMTPGARERILGVVLSHAAAVSVAWAHPADIDRLNILRATLLAMGRAARRAAGRAPGPALVLVDGPRRVPDLGLPQEAVVDADAKSLAVACASVVAKVLRDRWMRRQDRRFPGYGLARHKGYGTKAHLEALARLGPSPVHRLTYAPVARLTAGVA